MSITATQFMSRHLNAMALGNVLTAICSLFMLQRVVSADGKQTLSDIKDKWVATRTFKSVKYVIDGTHRTPKGEFSSMPELPVAMRGAVVPENDYIHPRHHVFVLDRSQDWV